jgi:hypothetical protein
MAIEDVLLNFNPMDIVKGYEFGLERGRVQEKHKEDIERERLLTEITKLRVLPAAQLEGMKTGAKIEALGGALPQYTEQQRQEIAIGISGTQRRGAEEKVRRDTLDDRMRALSDELTARASPERTKVRIEGEAAGDIAVREQSRLSGMTNQQLIEEREGLAEAATTIQKVQDEQRQAFQADPNAPQLDRWEAYEAAITRAQTRVGRAALTRARDEQARISIQGAAEAGDANTLNNYLRRYGQNMEVVRVRTKDPATGAAIPAWQIIDLVTETTPEGRVTRRVPRTDGYIAEQDAPTALAALIGIGPGGQPGRGRTKARPTAPRVVRPPAPVKEKQREPGEAGKGAAGGTEQPTDTRPRVTPEIQRHLNKLGVSEAAPQAPAESALTAAFQDLTSAEQRAVSALSAQARTFAQMNAAAKNENERSSTQLLMDQYNKQIEALLARGAERAAQRVSQGASTSFPAA